MKNNNRYVTTIKKKILSIIFFFFGAALSLHGSRWALSEDSGFNSYPSRPEGYLVKNVMR